MAQTITTTRPTEIAFNAQIDLVTANCSSLTLAEKVTIALVRNYAKNVNNQELFFTKEYITRMVESSVHVLLLILISIDNVNKVECEKLYKMFNEFA